MDNIIYFINEGMLVIIPVLYFIGEILKKSPVPDWLIPILLGIAGIILAFLWQLQYGEFELFGIITQGILCAAAGVYTKNIVKQISEKK